MGLGDVEIVWGGWDEGIVWGGGMAGVCGKDSYWSIVLTGKLTSGCTLYLFIHAGRPVRSTMAKGRLRLM